MVILKVRKISKMFSGLLALNNVDFDLHEGEILGLIGPNGSGKTTLFNVITGNYKPDKGKVIYGGKDITGWRSDKICRIGIGRTFQLIHPFESMNVYDNVKVGAVFGKRNSLKPQQLDHKIMDVLTIVGLNEKCELPVEKLTIGELRHLELARALATSPDVLLLDEVLAGLTNVEIEELMEKIRSIRDMGITILIIEHIMKAIMGLSDRIMVLEFGVKIADCGPDEVICNQRVVEAYLGEEDEEETT